MQAGAAPGKEVVGLALSAMHVRLGTAASLPETCKPAAGCLLLVVGQATGVQSQIVEDA